MHGDGRARVTGTCCQCDADTSDADEALCRLCLQDQPSVYGPDSPRPTSGEVQDMGVRLVAAASTLPHPWTARATTPTARAVPLQTAAGTLSPHIPLVIASPLGTSNSTVQGAGKVKRQRPMTEEQAAKKKVTDRESQKRRVGRMQALQSENVAHQQTIKTLEKKIRGLTASLQLKVGGKSNANSTTRGGLHEHLLITHYANWQ